MWPVVIWNCSYRTVDTEEPQTWRTNYKLYVHFLPRSMSALLTPEVSKGPLYLLLQALWEKPRKGWRPTSSLCSTESPDGHEPWRCVLSHIGWVFWRWLPSWWLTRPIADGLMGVRWTPSFQLYGHQTSGLSERPRRVSPRPHSPNLPPNCYWFPLSQI